MNAHAPVAERIAPLVPRLAPLLGKLGSAHDGEVVAAVRAIDRQLGRNGLSWNDLGRALWGGAARRVERAREPDVVLRSWRCAVQWIAAHPHWEPGERERQFVADMNRILKRHAPTERQAEWIRGIVERLGGRIP